MRVSTVGYTVKQGVKNIVRNKMFSIASIATMAACIFLFGVFFSIITNFSYIVDKAEEGMAIVIFFDEDATDLQLKNIRQQLEARDDVLEVKYVPGDQALQDFAEENFKDYPEIIEDLKKDNPLANSNNYEVYMKSVESQKQLVEFAEGLEGVRKVNKSDVVANTLSSVNVLIAYVSGAIILILLIVAVFLISNTVAMGITIRREEIAIMKYIGAKDGFVKAPFVIEGVMIGLIGAAIPLIVLYYAYEKAIFYILNRFAILNNILDFLPVSEVYRTLLPTGLALGVGIGFVGSFLTIRKHLKV